ncbi:hypothetical protein BH09BAC6_BH09BAC6_06600 [soil metagenome]|jgi:hypothetical protein
MNKSFYNFTIFFLSLTLASGFLQGIIYLLLGPQMFYLETFLPWFFTLNLIAFIGSLFLLNYYYAKQFRFAFYMAAIFIVSNLCLAAIFFFILLTGKLAAYYTPALCVVLGADSLYGISLIFSTAREKPWLKAAGICILTISVSLMSVWLLSMIYPGFQKNGAFVKITRWISLIGSLLPALYIRNFLDELRILKEDNAPIPMRQSMENIIGFAGILAFIFTLTFGITMAKLIYSSVNRGEDFEKLKKWSQLFEARTFVNGKGDTLFYRLLKPLNYDPKKKYPLVVCLPYGGQPGTDKIRQIEGAAAAELLTTDSNRKKYPAFIFVPNCPNGSGWGGIPNYPSVDTLVYKAISSLDKEPGIDVKRRYVTGLSGGGYGTWNFICTRPDMFAAAIPVCGGGNPKLASKIVHVAVWAFHGENDRNVRVSGSRDMIKAMKKAGGNPRYTEYPDKGHNIWENVSITPGLFDWLFAQKRN